MTNVIPDPEWRNDSVMQLLAELSKGMESVRNEEGLTVEEAFAGLED